jgi:lysyl endopeptidase
MLRFPHLVAALALLAAPAAAARLPVVHGEPAALAGTFAPQPRLRLPPAKAAARVELADVAAQALARVREENLASSRSKAHLQLRRVVIGVVRATDGEMGAPPASQLQWSAVDGGFAARVTVISPQAGSLRLAIDLAGVPTDVEMVVFGSADPGRLEGPVRVGDVADRTSAWWTPLTEGETQTVEVFVPARHDPEAIALGVDAASHVFTTPSSRFTKRLQDIGDSGSCNVDVPCSPLAGSSAFRNVAESVAQMVFVADGFSVLCTGTLLADADASTQVPWLYSANHCFENTTEPFKTAAQMQSVANTLSTLWAFEAASCGSSTPASRWSQLAGGATLVHNNAHNDVLFLRLNGTPPAGAFYSGWDAATVGAGAALVAVHHPQGDLKKVTQGSVTGFAVPGVAGGTQSYIEARWTSGTTERGSSGGGIWTSSGGEYFFRGGLWGGFASCQNPTSPDYYSRFDQAFPALSAYLAASAVPTANYTDLWWNPAESGWGLNLVQHPSHIVFGVWYTYDTNGKRTWFVMSSGTWSDSKTYSGTLYAVTGPAYTTGFNPSLVERRPVGTVTLRFSDANNGTFRYSVDGVAGEKIITRQPF